MQQSGHHNSSRVGHSAYSAGFETQAGAKVRTAGREAPARTRSYPSCTSQSQPHSLLSSPASNHGFRPSTALHHPPYQPYLSVISLYLEVSSLHIPLISRQHQKHGPQTAGLGSRMFPDSVPSAWSLGHNLMLTLPTAQGRRLRRLRCFFLELKRP